MGRGLISGQSSGMHCSIYVQLRIHRQREINGNCPVLYSRLSSSPFCACSQFNHSSISIRPTSNPLSCLCFQNGVAYCIIIAAMSPANAGLGGNSTIRFSLDFGKPNLEQIVKIWVKMPNIPWNVLIQMKPTHLVLLPRQLGRES